MPGMHDCPSAAVAKEPFDDLQLCLVANMAVDALQGNCTDDLLHCYKLRDP